MFIEARAFAQTDFGTEVGENVGLGQLLDEEPFQMK